MNILFLNSLDKAKWGGGEKWMINAGNGLAEREHRVTIACKQGSVIEQKAKESGLDIFRFSIPADIAFWKTAPLKSFLTKHETDVLICCQNKDVKIGARAARSHGINAIFARQGIQNLTNKKKYIKPFSQYIDGIITNTNSIKNIYEGFGWFPKNFNHVIYNGVKMPENITQIDLHKKYDLPLGSKIIFSSGRLDYQKGFDLLIDVAIKAKRKSLNWQIIIAGEGKLKSELNSLAAKNEVLDMIHFIGFSNEVPALLEASDIFVLPSRYEGMPNALLEAMASGKASVATNVNGAPELVEDGVSGFLVESENSNQLFEKLHELLTNDKLRKSIEYKAKSSARNNFTNEKMIDALEKLFKNQIEKSGKTS